MNSDAAQPRVAIVGGGLAGMAAAAALSTTHCQVQLFEARRRFGGRATSFRDPASGELVDLCQHVSMRCCTNLADLARRTGIADDFEPTGILHFIGPDGRQYDLQASRWLPAPLHLALGMRRLRYLTFGDQARIVWALGRLLIGRFDDGPDTPTVAAWLRGQRQSQRAVDWFWAVVLVSALGESLEHASIAAARKVFVDGFLASREAYIVEVPRVPLGTLYGERIPAWLAGQGVEIRYGAAVKQVSRGPNGKLLISLTGSEPQEFDHVVVAVPWHQLSGLFADELVAAEPRLTKASQLAAAPITGVHLWFDRPITALPHAVLIGRLGQWLFNRSGGQTIPVSGTANEFYYQVVISASRDLSGRDRDDLVTELCRELADIWPEAANAKLLRSRVVTENSAVFSVRPGSLQLRPPQRTRIDGLYLAGDWTATGWPSTMEGAVRSGYLAAEEVTASLGARKRFVVPDLPRSWLARLLPRNE